MICVLTALVLVKQANNIDTRVMRVGVRNAAAQCLTQQMNSSTSEHSTADGTFLQVNQLSR